MSIGRRLTLGYIAIALIATMVVGLSVQLSRQVWQLRTTELPMEQHIHQAEERLWESVHTLNSFAWRPDPKYEAQFEEHLADMEEVLGGYRALIDTAEERQAVDEVEELWDQIRVNGRELLLLVREKKEAEDLLFNLVDHADDVIDFQVQAKFSDSDPQLNAKERSVREVEVSIWEAIHAAQQYTGLSSSITRSGHAQGTFSELMESQFKDVEEFWGRYKLLATTEEERKAIDEFDQIWASAVEQGRRVVVLHDRGDKKTEEISDLAEQVDDVIDDKITTTINERIVARDQSAQRTMFITVAIGLLAMASAIIIAVVVTRSICRPIDRLRLATTALAAGNLQYRIESDLTDELGDVSVAFDQMAVEMANFTGTLQGEIEERRGAEELLRASNIQLTEITDRLTHVNTELKDFVYVASHDLREPLRKVSSFGALLRDSLKGTLSEDDEENLAFMIDGAERMTEMIEGLLAYSRLNTRDGDRRKIDLHGVIAELQKLELATMLEESAGSIEIPQPLPAVFGNGNEIRQLLQNVISNGIKYRRDGVEPRIVVRGEPDDAGMIRVTVEDNGIGVPAQHRESVFKMFRRLHSRSKYSGTGIGLSVCRKVVDKHGGHIGFDEHDGPGATVWFTLPVVSQERPEACATTQTESA